MNPFPALCSFCCAVLVLPACASQTATRAVEIAPGGCPADSVCFNVYTAAQGPLGSTDVVLVWNDPGSRIRPLQARLATLSGNERSVAIPRAAIRSPTTPPFGQTWGYVFAVPQGTAGLVGMESMVGVARMMFVHVVNAREQAPHVAQKFPAGIVDGAGTYFLRRDGAFDDFVLAPPGAVFDLAICPTTAPKCGLPYPNPD